MRILALDVGTKRVGVAFADTSVRIAIPRGMVPVDGNEFAEIAKQCRLEKAEVLVVGQPRNSKGEITAQTEWVYTFIIALKEYFVKHNQKAPLIKYQDESLTSVQAETLLGGKKHELSRRDRAEGKVDAEAAALILQDFLESANFAQIEQELKGE